MFLALYQIYRTYVLDSTICFSIVSGTMYLLFGPKRRMRWLRPWLYLVVSAISFSFIFQGLLIALLGGKALIFSDPLHYLYFFLCQVSLAFLWSCLLLRGDVFPKLIYILILVAFMQLYRGVCAPLYDMEGVMEPTLYASLDLVTAVGLYACLVSLAFLFKRYRINTSALLDGRIRFIMLYILVSLLASMLLPELIPSVGSSNLVVALVMSDFPLIYYIFGRFAQNLEEQARMEQALAKAQAEWMVYERSQELRNTIREERHELKNHYFRLLVLMREGKTYEVEAELENRIGSISEESRDIETGIAYLDYLIAAKEAAAREAGIEFRVESEIADGLYFDEMAAGTILSNLTDNAIEASLGEGRPCIEVRIRYVRGYLHGKVSNRVSRDVLAVNPDLRTTKADRWAHGLGLKIVRKTLDEHEGMLSTEVKDGWFVASFMLPVEKMAIEQS